MTHKGRQSDQKNWLTGLFTFLQAPQVAPVYPTAVTFAFLNSLNTESEVKKRGFVQITDR